MKSGDLSTQRFVLDMKSAQDLRQAMRQDSKLGLKEAAKQFEGMFLQMMLKSMRDATPQEGMFNSDATRFYTSVLDQQLASQLGATGQLGFARQIESQLGRSLGAGNAGSQAGGEAGAQGMLRTFGGVPTMPAGAVQGAERVAASVPEVDTGLPVSGGAASPATRDFVNRVWPGAVEASRATGIPAHFLVAQAALETGWGKSEIRRADGSSSYNLFGIKAGRGWQGDSVEAATTEFVNGEAHSTRERFRAYSSYADSFRDYANLLLNNPRYSGVLGQRDGTAFAQSLQQAGYATDPLYADKLSRIINGSTLRQALYG